MTGIMAQDRRLAGIALEERKGLIIVGNKWDLVREQAGEVSQNELAGVVRELIPFAGFAPITFLSAKTHRRLGSLMPVVTEVAANLDRRIPTPQLNSIVRRAVLAHPPRGPRRQGSTDLLCRPTRHASAALRLSLQRSRSGATALQTLFGEHAPAALRFSRRSLDARSFARAQGMTNARERCRSPRVNGDLSTLGLDRRPDRGFRRSLPDRVDSVRLSHRTLLLPHRHSQPRFREHRRDECATNAWGKPAPSPYFCSTPSRVSHPRCGRFLSFGTVSTWKAGRRPHRSSPRSSRREPCSAIVFRRGFDSRAVRESRPLLARSLR